jgi:hypothetical protein
MFGSLIAGWEKKTLNTQAINICILHQKPWLRLVQHEKEVVSNANIYREDFYFVGRFHFSVLHGGRCAGC